jgi:peptidyl-dipeptidase Dcp
MRDVETLFHEFGHAIHEMISASKLSELSGFNVEWDFVELPSQLLENWVGDRESLEKLAKHHETSEKLPENILTTLKDLETYMSGY